MKDRIKKFYQDHQNVCVYAATMVATATTAVVLIKTGERNSKIEGFGTMIDGDKMHARVFLKNGTFRDFSKDLDAVLNN